LFEEELAIRRTMDDPFALAEFLNNMAFIYYYERGEYAEAEPWFKEALTIWQRYSDAPPVSKAISLNGLLAIYNKQGRKAEAEGYLKEAQDIHATIVEQNVLEDAYALEVLAQLYDDQGNNQAEAIFKQAVAIFDSALRKDHPDKGHALSELGLFYYKHKNYEAAEERLNEALNCQKDLVLSPALARTYYRLALLRSDQGRYDDAERLFKKAEEIQEKSIPNHPDLAATKDGYAAMRIKMQTN
jgi:tetratricopeptide (TPR) repeat protein